MNTYRDTGNVRNRVGDIEYDTAVGQLREIELLEKYRDLLLERKQRVQKLENRDNSKFGLKQKAVVRKPDTLQYEDSKQLSRIFELKSMPCNPREADSELEDLSVRNHLQGIANVLQKRNPEPVNLSKVPKPNAKTPKPEVTKETRSRKMINELLAQRELEQKLLEDFKVPKFVAKPLPMSTFSSESKALKNKAFELRVKASKERVNGKKDSIKELTPIKPKTTVKKGTSIGTKDWDWLPKDVKPLI